MIGSSLQKKAVLIVAGILFLILGVNTFVLTLVASDKYRSAILAKNSTAGEALQKDLGRALELGVTLESIQGVNEKLHELVSRDTAVGYAAVADKAGKVLFHNDQGAVGKLTELVSEIAGLRPVYLGPLALTYQAEILTPMLLNAAKRNKMKNPGVKLI